MERNLFENARKAVSRFTQNRNGRTKQEDMETARQAIQSAYSQCSPEEQQQLQQLEQQLDSHHQNLK